MRTLGVVLCGGASSRMGRDKGLILDNEVSWAGRARSVLASVCDRVVCSINPGQQAEYAAAMGGVELVVDSVSYQDMGPLGGLLSVHEKFPEWNILLLACDMIMVGEDNLRPLLLAGGEIAAYKAGDLYEPLCAYYSAAACGKIAAFLKAGKVAASLQKILRFPELDVVAIPETDAAFLKSQNTPVTM